MMQFTGGDLDADGTSAPNADHNIPGRSAGPAVNLAHSRVSDKIGPWRGRPAVVNTKSAARNAVAHSRYEHMPSYPVLLLRNENGPLTALALARPIRQM
jgi:hypothetical protein